MLQGDGEPDFAPVVCARVAVWRGLEDELDAGDLLEWHPEISELS